MQGGSSEDISVQDRMDPARANALFATLGQVGNVNSGDALPPFFHQIYFWQPLPPDALGPDGHPALGHFVPDLGLPNRMWAGGHLKFHADLHAGISAEKTSRVEKVEKKTGRTGPLAFVSIRHTIRQRGALVVSERQDLVYRGHGPAGTPPVTALAPEVRREVTFNATMLFRYSALTFNGHRIHYDIDYCREAEGYPGLVVHGPLLAQNLMLVAAERLGTLTEFKFRATAPLFHFESATLCMRGNDLWVVGPDGRICMQAEAR